MEHPASSPCSEAATKAFGHLRGVAKQLQNEGLVFNKQTVQHLEDAIKAVKDLEEDRKHTIELWEEETIKNCNLRIRIKGVPDMVMKEFKELVSAARRFHSYRLGELKTSINETITAVESQYSRQKVSEEENVTLCEEEAELWAKHQGVISLVNRQLSEKHTANIELNHLYNLQREEEEEIVRRESAILELKKIMVAEAIEFKEKKEVLDTRIADLQKLLDAKRLQNASKRDEYHRLLPEMEDLEKKTAEHKKTISDLRAELGELFKKVKLQIQEFQENKAKKEDLLKKKMDLQIKTASLHDVFNQEREDLLQKILLAEEQLELANRCFEKLKSENELYNTQLQAYVTEEEHYCQERDKLNQDLEYLSNMLTEKLDCIARRFMETRSLEEEMERLQEIYESSQNTYANEISNLEITLQREGERRKKLQDQLEEISALYQKLMAEHEALLKSSKDEGGAVKQQLSLLTSQNEELDKEIKKYEETMKHLTAKLSKKEAEYKKRDANLEKEIQNLEALYHSKLKRLLEMKEELEQNLPLEEELASECERRNTVYTAKQDLCKELQEEERMLKKAIEKSIKEIGKLKRQRFQAKNEIKKNREMTVELQKRFTISLKYIERDNYEISRQLYLLNGENARLRAGIAYFKEDISTMEKEIKVYQSERQNIYKNRRELYNYFIKKWIKDENLHKVRFDLEIQTFQSTFVKEPLL
nr:coiled-coil domain-containing protein 175-like [Anolis sagrei ordinatus]